MKTRNDRFYFNNAICLFCVICAGVLAVFSVWFLFRSEEPSTGYYPGTVHIAINPFPGYAALYIAEDQGFFEKNGVRVSLKRYESPAEITGAFMIDKDLEGRTNLTYDTVEESHKGIDQKIVVIVDQSIGADALVAKTAIRSVAELKGKRIALDADSFQMFFLYHMLKDAYLVPTDVELVPSTSSEYSLELLESNRADAAIVFEPVLSQIVDQQIGSVLVSSEEYPQIITDVLTLRSDFIHMYPNSVQAIVNAYFEGYDFIQSYPLETEQILAREFGVAPNELLDSLEGVGLYSLEDNLYLSRSGFVSDSIYLHLLDIQNFLLRSLNYVMYVNTDMLVDPQFMRQTQKRADTML